MLVVGSPNSSNSNRLRELAERMGTPAYLIDQASQIKPEWLDGKQSVGVTAGASAPEILVNDVISRLRDLGGDLPEEIAGREENIVFSMPRELRIDAVDVS
jgi:4-hydroxy-3-methylbut-2-enyl diphosphate reductase